MLPSPTFLRLVHSLRAAARHRTQRWGWKARGWCLWVRLAAWPLVVTWLGPPEPEYDGSALLGLNRRDTLRAQLYPWRLAGAMVLWHFALVLVLLSFSPWSTPPMQLLGWAPPHLRLAWLALVLASVVKPDYDDWPAVRGGLVLLPLPGLVLWGVFLRGYPCLTAHHGSVGARYFATRYSLREAVWPAACGVARKYSSRAAEYREVPAPGTVGSNCSTW